MNAPDTSRTAVLLATASAVLWAAKSVAIGRAGGLGLSPAEDPLFFLGLAASILATACLALALARGRSRTVRVLAALASLPAALLLAVVTQTLVRLVQPRDPGWPWGEANLWVAAAVVLCAAVVVRRRTAREEAVAGTAYPAVSRRNKAGARRR